MRITSRAVPSDASSAATKSSVLRKRRCEARQRIRASVTASVAGDLTAPLPACGVAGPRITSESACASSIVDRIVRRGEDAMEAALARASSRSSSTIAASTSCSGSAFARSSARRFSVGCVENQ